MEHHNAKTIDEAVSLLGMYMEESNIVAGGTDVVSLMKNEVISPKVLVNIKTISELSYIREDNGGLRIGSLTTIHDIETSGMIRDRYGILAEAAHSIAAPQVRNMSTIGGNLCQQVWCWYYRRSPVTGLTFTCRRKGGKRCYAIDGDNTYHSIIGRNECYAVCPSDMASALLALGGRLKIVGPSGEKQIPLDDFYMGMGNILKPNEIVTEIHVPIPKSDTKQRYLKFRLRKAIDFAISSVAAAITTDAGVVSDARIILGGVAANPYRALASEEAIKGKVITEDIAEVSAKAWMSEATPLSMNAYKLPVTEALVRRAILD